ncbi:MAG: Septum formation initiator [Verrucomicrobia bacterium]|jgi:cell division protein FtsB|nr:Septum formation initiator [Verrucomicrobiota bacterium]
MSDSANIWDRLTQFVLVLIVIAILLGVGVWYLPLIQRNERMRKEILRLDNEIRLEETKARELKASIDTLRDPATAPKAVERLARERLGYAKPGETIIRFEPPGTNNVSTMPAQGPVTQ